VAIAAESSDRVAIVAPQSAARSAATLWVIGLAAAIVAVSAWMYGQRLSFAPPHLEIDEILIGLDGHAIAHTGRDLGGEWLPLYSQTAEHSWYQPFVVYATALALRLLPLNEWSVRTPTVCVALLNIAVIFFAARQLFGSIRAAMIAAVTLALSPGHFIHTRYGMDYVYPVPFILGWLICLGRYVERRDTRMLAAATAILGVGFYSYIASIVMMPVYAAITCLVLWRLRMEIRDYGLALATFAVWLLPFTVWLARHPSAFGGTVEKYGLYDARQLNAVQGLRSFISIPSISERLSEYWNFYNPSFLFFGAGTKVMFSTNLAGVFLVPVAVFLIVGIVRAVRERTPMQVVLLLGFFTAPLAALIVQEGNAIFRALAFLPFGALLATLGFETLWSAAIEKSFSPMIRPIGIAVFALGAGYAAWTLATSATLTRSSLPVAALGALIVAAAGFDRTTQWRIVAAVLLLAMAVQFRSFWSDYFSDYRVRSAVWLGGNIGGALEELIDRVRVQPAPAVFFTTLQSTSGKVDGRDQYMPAYWRFYLTKHHREDLLARTHELTAGASVDIPSGSLVLGNLGNPALEARVASGQLRSLTTIPELDGHPFFWVLGR